MVEVRTGTDRKEEQNGVAELNAFRSLTTLLIGAQKSEETTFRSRSSRAGVAVTEIMSGANTVMS